MNGVEQAGAVYLIAPQQDLLQAAKAVAGALERITQDPHYDAFYGDTLAALKAAIAKATGEQA